MSAARRHRRATAADLPPLHIGAARWRPAAGAKSPNRPNGRLPHIPITFQNLSDE
ncbi:hypothetical protein BSLA_01f0272 [Burkholderia stabilis]|nr:hypothetical protein BSLA_01f0272 [Burkholderia stabilis]